VQEYTIELRNMDIMLDISPKNLYVLLKYLGGINSHLQNKVVLFNPMKIDEAYVSEHYLQNIGHKKGQPSRSKQKENKDASKEGKNKWKWKYKRMKDIEHKINDPRNHCNIDGNIEEKC
jgi:hypothetical protein